MTAAAEKAAHVWERDPHDWYVEEPRATEALLSVERFVGAVWDPACGQGNILTAFLRSGLDQSLVAGTDIVRRTDSLWFRGEIDFLAYDGVTLAQNVVMNPPFYRAKGAESFIRRALSLAAGKVAAFVDVRFLAGSDRANGLFAEHPPHRIWIITPRVSCPPGSYLAAGGRASGGSADWCWLVWDRTAPPPSTSQLGWLRRPSSSKDA